MAEVLDGTSQPRTVSETASLFEDLISRDETPTVPDSSTSKKADESAADESTTEEEGQTETPQSEESNESDESTQDEDSEQEDTDTADVPAPRKFKVKVDGQELEISEDEALKGYSRTADYTRKTQKLSEERTAFQNEAAAVREERKRYAESLTELDNALKSITPVEPDWDYLRQNDPLSFAETWATWDQHKQRLAAVTAEKDAALEATLKDQQKALATHLEGERGKLMEAIPAWKDDAIATKEKTAIAEYAKEAGYTDADLAQITDHRVMLILRKAMLYDKVQKARPAFQQQIDKVKTATPGAASSTQKQVSDTTRAKMTLAKTGRVRDAARAFETMLD